MTARRTPARLRGAVLLIFAFSFSCAGLPVSVPEQREAGLWRPAARLKSAPLPATLVMASPAGLEEKSVAATSQDGILGLAEVIDSVERHFPLILAAQTEVDEAIARTVGARGAFDLGFSARAESQVEGFYEKDRLDFGLEQQLRWSGMKLFGGYRRGVGDFDDYQEGFKTNDGGELRIGLSLPLLRGRAIDSRRIREWQALVGEERARPLVQAKRLEAIRKSAMSYWRWVANGQRLVIAERLLSLARDRQEQVASGVDEGQLAPIAGVENRRLIVERETEWIKATRGMEKAAIDLSLYLRDEDGQPLLVTRESMPAEFPGPTDPEEMIDRRAEALALAKRPELQVLALELESLDLDRDLAKNDLLPSLALDVGASKDNGDASSLPDEKDPFEFKAAVRFDVPLQRRSARGKLRAVEAKRERAELKLSFGRDQVVLEVRDATSALRQSWLRIGQARENVRLANVLADAERVQFQEGESDLFRVNLREQQAAVAEDKLVDVYAEHFRAQAAYQTVLGSTDLDSGQS